MASVASVASGALSMNFPRGARNETKPMSHDLAPIVPTCLSNQGSLQNAYTSSNEPISGYALGALYAETIELPKAVAPCFVFTQQS